MSVGLKNKRAWRKHIITLYYQAPTLKTLRKNYTYINYLLSNKMKETKDTRMFYNDIKNSNFTFNKIRGDSGHNAK